MRLYIRTLIFTKKILTTGGRKLVYIKRILAAGPGGRARPPSRVRPLTPAIDEVNFFRLRTHNLADFGKN